MHHGEIELIWVHRIIFFLSNDFPCPVWGEWYAISNCTSSCSRIRQISTNKELYVETNVLVEIRNCKGEKNFFSCKDYARVNGDTDPRKLHNVRQDTKCNQNICSGQYYY